MATGLMPLCTRTVYRGRVAGMEVIEVVRGGHAVPVATSLEGYVHLWLLGNHNGGGPLSSQALEALPAVEESEEISKLLDGPNLVLCADHNILVVRCVRPTGVRARVNPAGYGVGGV